MKRINIFLIALSIAFGTLLMLLTDCFSAINGVSTKLIFVLMFSIFSLVILSGVYSYAMKEKNKNIVSTICMAACCIIAIMSLYIGVSSKSIILGVIFLISFLSVFWISSITYKS